MLHIVLCVHFWCGSVRKWIGWPGWKAWHEWVSERNGWTLQSRFGVIDKVLAIHLHFMCNCCTYSLYLLLYVQFCSCHCRCSCRCCFHKLNTYIHFDFIFTLLLIFTLESPIGIHPHSHTNNFSPSSLFRSFILSSIKHSHTSLNIFSKNWQTLMRLKIGFSNSLLMFISFWFPFLVITASFSCWLDSILNPIRN